jgi:large subunit ribosomal protein L17
MRHLAKGKKLGQDTAHRRALLRNLVTSFLEKERIRTSLAKAARPLAEKMITLGKRNTLHARRKAIRFVFRKAVVKKLFDELGPRFSERPGGYTRIVKIGPRRGDGADMALLELIGTEFKKKEKKKPLKEKLKEAKATK